MADPRFIHVQKCDEMDYRSFVTIDPIGILKNYISDLQDNLQKMGTQIGNLKGQMRKLVTIVEENNKEIQNNMLIAKSQRTIQ